MSLYTQTPFFYAQSSLYTKPIRAPASFYRYQINSVVPMKPRLGGARSKKSKSKKGPSKKSQSRKGFVRRAISLGRRGVRRVYSIGRRGVGRAYSIGRRVVAPPARKALSVAKRFGRVGLTAATYFGLKQLGWSDAKIALFYVATGRLPGLADSWSWL